MAQHFLLSAAAGSLTLAKVARISDDEARDAFRMIRWSSTEGAPVCPCCCLAVYSYRARPIFKCKGCEHQFSVTSGTIFASRKLPVRDYLLAIAISVNGAKGHSALQLSRDLDVQYKTAFVMAHKIREALAAEKAGETVSDTVSVDGAYFGGYVKPSNYKENRRDLALRSIRTASAASSSLPASMAARRFPSSSRAKQLRCRPSRKSSCPAQPFTPMKPRIGMRCTPSS